jgi:MFS family permease
MAISLFVSLIFFSRLLALFSFTPLVIDLVSTLNTNPSTLQLSLLTGSYGIAQAVFQYPFARLSDKISRLHLIQVLLLIFTCASFGAYFSYTPALLIFFRALQGACAFQALIHAYLADYYEPLALKKIMLYIGLAVTLSLLIGYSFPLLVKSQLSDLRLPFFISGLLSFFCFIQSFNLVYPSAIRSLYSDEKILSDKSLNWAPFFLNSLIHFSHSFLMMSIACKKDYALSEKYLFLLLGSLIIALPGLSPKIGKLKTLEIIFFLLIIHLLSFIFVKMSFFSYFLVLFNFSLLFIFEASIPSLLLIDNPTHQKGYLMGLNSTFQYMAMALGAMFAPYAVSIDCMLPFYFFITLISTIAVFLQKKGYSFEKKENLIA